MKAGLAWAVPALMVLAVPVTAGEEQPLRLAATSPWWLNYDDDSCTMKRVFGSGADTVGLTMEAFGPGASFHLSITGKPLKAWTNEKSFNLRFGPDGEEQEARYFSVRAADRSPGIRLRSPVGIARTLPSISTDPAEDGQQRYIVDTAREQRVTELILQRTQRDRPIILELQSMGEPLKALRKCEIALIEVWGLDPAKYLKLTRGPEPLTPPQRWMGSFDYPQAQLMGGERAIIHFRLNVDETGKATSCHIQRALGDKAFEKAVCTSLMAHAKFAPAMDENGQPTQSAFVSSVSFVINE